MKHKLKKLTRISEWWASKVGLLLGMFFFLAYLQEFYNYKVFIYLVLSLVTFTGIGWFGHILNDLGDIKQDAIAEKPNSMSNLSFISRGLLILFSLLIAIFPWFLGLPFSTFSIILLSLEFLLLMAYSLLPIRLKRYPKIAIFVDSIYAYALPAILASYTYMLLFEASVKTYLLLYPLFFMTLCIGLRHVLYHHIYDANNDKKSNTPNLVNIFGTHKVIVFVTKKLLPVEVFFALIFFSCSLYFYNTKAVPFLVIYLFFLSWGNILQYKNILSNTTKLGFKVDEFYIQFFWFLAATFWVVASHRITHALYLIPLFFIINSSWTSYFKKKVSINFLLINQAISKFINYTIYYFRKIVLNWSEERNRGVFYKDWLKKQEEKNKPKIAVFNHNDTKYTETFVRGHLKNLPFKISFYYGTFYINKLGYGNVFKSDKLIHLANTKNKETVYSVIQNQLIQDQVTLILCEFGTVGADLIPISKRTGIPLVVIFYGYDIWHSKTLESNKDKYTELFKIAPKIIGVSKDICRRLEDLGCPKEKITYLPCFVDLMFFTETKHNHNHQTLLSVGRFAETKAPHLTILAFNEVLKQYPKARLRMIGRDGGGELFEACQILAKALKIEKQVDFLGICSPEKVKKEMQQAAVFVQHSLTTPLHGDKEGTPVAIMEAMASGLAVVSTKHAGISELIKSNENGILVEEYDYIGMSKAMIYLLENKTERLKLGENAAKSIRENKMVSKSISKLTDIINTFMIKKKNK